MVLFVDCLLGSPLFINVCFESKCLERSNSSVWIFGNKVYFFIIWLSSSWPNWKVYKLGSSLSALDATTLVSEGPNSLFLYLISFILSSSRSTPMLSNRSLLFVDDASLSYDTTESATEFLKVTLYCWLCYWGWDRSSRCWVPWDLRSTDPTSSSASIISVTGGSFEF